MVEAPKIRETLCKQFHVSHTTVTNIIRDYLLHRRVYSSGKLSIGRSGNTCAKESRILRTVSLLIAVRNFVRSHCLKRARVTCRQVLDYFIQEDVVNITTDASGQYESKAFHAAFRATRHWVKDFSSRSAAGWWKRLSQFGSIFQ